VNISEIDSYALNVPAVKVALDEKRISKDGGLLDWSYFAALIKKHRNQQIKSLKESETLTDREFIEAIIEKHKLEIKISKGIEYAFNCVFFYILEPIGRSVNEWTGAKKQYDDQAEGHAIRDWINYVKNERTPDRIITFLFWLWRDHDMVAAKFYEDIGVELRLPRQRSEKPCHSKDSVLRRYKIPTPDPENPFDEGNIPFQYRDAELEKLEAFAAKDTQFQIWAISGPSGSGKTRLAHHWLLTSKIMEKWDQIVIEAKSRTHGNPDYWQNEFELHRPTVLVMDYVDSMLPTFQTLRDRFRELAESGKLPHKVRLLLIDHVFPESLADLDKDTRLGFHGMGKNDTVKYFDKIFFGKSPLNLKETADQDDLMKYLITHAAGIEVKENTVTDALAALNENRKKAGEWYHPLFAILIGDTLKQANPEKPLPSPDTWNRRQLIENYLSNNRRLPWLMSEEPQTALEKHYRDINYGRLPA
jgi:DNA replication protein DnaC